MAKSEGKFLGGMLLGAGIGVVAGLLIAPRSGKETRTFIRKTVKKVPLLAEKAWEETLIRLQEAILAGQEASQRLQDEREYDAATVETSARSDEK